MFAMPFSQTLIRRGALLCAAVGGVLALPAVAPAATLSASGTTITFQAAPGETNDLIINWLNVPGDPPRFSELDPGGPAIVPQPPGCESGTSDSSCPSAGLTPLVIAFLGDGNDRASSLNSEGRGKTTRLHGEAGNDSLISNESSDVLDGGPGDDTLVPDSTFASRGDTVIGGEGIDTLDLSDYVSAGNQAATPVVTLDGVANDGEPEENDNYGADIENVIGPRFGVSITGTAAANRLQGGFGNDVLVGGGGADVLIGVTGDDRIEARDGVTDSIDCGGGNDIAFVDPSDAVTGCENVQRGPAIAPPAIAPPVSGPPVSAPPAIAPPSSVSVGALTPRLVLGRVKVRIGCRLAPGRTCRGTVRIRSTSKVRVGRAKAKLVTLGSAPFAIAGGKVKTVTLKLGRAGRSVMRGRRSLKISVSAHPQGGGTAATRKLTLRR